MVRGQGWVGGGLRNELEKGRVSQLSFLCSESSSHPASPPRALGSSTSHGHIVIEPQ